MLLRKKTIQLNCVIPLIVRYSPNTKVFFKNYFIESMKEYKKACVYFFKLLV